MWRVGIVSSTQANLVVSGNVAAVIAVRVLVGIVDGALLATTSYTGLSAQWMF